MDFKTTQLGANAVINIKCRRNLLSFRQFEAKGLAVLTKDPAEKNKIRYENICLI